MLLLNRDARTLTMEDEQWNAVLEAGRERGWRDNEPGRLAEALMDYPPRKLSERLGIDPEELASLLSLLEHGSLPSLAG